MSRIICFQRLLLAFVASVALIALLFLSAGSAANAQTVAPASPIGPAITSISLAISPPASPLASPVPGTTYMDVRVLIEVSGFNLVDKIGQSNVPGEGHIIYYWAEPPTYPYRPAYSRAGTYSDPGTTSTVFTWTNSSTTYDIYAAQLVNNDDTPLNPPVYAEIISNHTVPGAAVNVPAITSFSISPALPATPPATATNKVYMDTRVSCQAAGLTLVPATNETNVAGQGHFIYYWTVAPLTAPNMSAYITDNFTFSTSATPFTFTGDTPGYRSYAIQLVNNDDTPFDPPVYAVIKTNVGLGMMTPSPSVIPTAAPAVVPAPSSSGVRIDVSVRDSWDIVII